MSKSESRFKVEIRVDDPRGAAAAELLQEHLSHMRAITPAGSVHALDLDALCAPEVTFWTAWIASSLAGCGALLELDEHHGELKSMRTSPEHRRIGVAGELLQHIIDEACRRGYRRLSLETGAGSAFQPAHSLYQRFGFGFCEPFGAYKADPNSVFMSLPISASA